MNMVAKTALKNENMSGNEDYCILEYNTVQSGTSIFKRAASSETSVNKMTSRPRTP
jgi:hypothetical protein